MENFTHRDAALEAIGAAKRDHETAASKDAQAVMWSQVAIAHAVLHLADVVAEHGTSSGDPV